MYELNPKQRVSEYVNMSDNVLNHSNGNILQCLSDCKMLATI